MKKQQQQHCALLSSLPLLSPLLSSPPLLPSSPLSSPPHPCSPPPLLPSPALSSPPLLSFSLHLPYCLLFSPPLLSPLLSSPPMLSPLLSSPSLLSPSVVDRGLLAANHPKPQPARTSKLTFREKNRSFVFRHVFVSNWWKHNNAMRNIVQLLQNKCWRAFRDDKGPNEAYYTRSNAGIRLEWLCIAQHSKYHVVVRPIISDSVSVLFSVDSQGDIRGKLVRIVGTENLARNRQWFSHSVKPSNTVILVLHYFPLCPKMSFYSLKTSPLAQGSWSINSERGRRKKVHFIHCSSDMKVIGANLSQDRNLHFCLLDLIRHRGRRGRTERKKEKSFNTISLWWAAEGCVRGRGTLNGPWACTDFRAV